jgi:RNA recognition motif-containing protein
MTRRFDTAMAQIDKKSDDEFKQICEKLRYFEIDGKPVRCLPFDKELLGNNRQNTLKKNIIVKKLPPNWKAKDLHEYFNRFGPVKSCKISLNEQHDSNKFGYVCF